MKKIKDWSRREIVKGISAATLSALAAGAPRTALAAVDAAGDLDNAIRRNPGADSVIVLWMGGGMASNETFDPKRHTPFKAGMKAGEVEIGRAHV